jgi:hypothetical protein
MNRIKRLFVDEEEEGMDINDDNDFTERYLSQFPSIESNTIEVLIRNGYQNRESLEAFDLKEDLPLLPDINMAQKSLLRKYLQQLKSEQEFEDKVNDIKGVDEEVVPNIYIESKPLKRKRDYINESQSSKRSRNTESTSDLSSRITRMTGARNSMRTSTQRKFETEVNPNLFEFADSRQIIGRRSISSRPNQSPILLSKESDSSSGEEVIELLKRRIKVEKKIEPKPLATLGSGSPKIRDSLEAINNRINRTSRLSTTPSTASKSETSHIPTPTELELREHLAKQKAFGKNKRGRKRN